MKSFNDIKAEWLGLSESQRDWWVCRAIGAMPMSQYFLTKMDGSLICSTQFSREQERDACDLLQFIKGKGRGDFSRRHLIPRNEVNHVSLQIREWPIRYSATPAGGWMVLEALRAAGVTLHLSSTSKGWKLIALKSGSTPTSILSAEIQEAACLLAVFLNPQPKQPHEQKK